MPVEEFYGLLYYAIHDGKEPMSVSDLEELKELLNFGE